MMLKLATRAWTATAVAVAVAGGALLAVPQVSAAAPPAAAAPQDSVPAFPLPQEISAYEVAFQDGTGGLSGSGFPYGDGSLGVAVAPGTSPSIAALSAGNTAFPNHGYVALFQGADGTLSYNTGAESGSLGPAMAPRTSPSVATAPSDPDGFRAAWQGANNHLWISGPTDTGLAMMPGTSPALAELPAGSFFLPSGGDVAVFQGSDGHEWFYTATASSSMGNSAVMAPGTSPSIVLAPSAGAGWRAAWQGTNNHLWTTGPSGPTDTGLDMMPGTSPALAELPVGNFFLPSGGDVAVFQGSDTHPWFYTATASSSMGNSAVMAPGTSPSIVLMPSAGAGWQAKWQGANNHLWTTGPSGPTDTGLAIMPGTSPSATAVSSL
jgi:hypothetical protein